MEITNRIDDRSVIRGLRKLESRGKNMRPAMEAIGDILVVSIEENFLAEGRYSDPLDWRGGSRSWRDLADTTVAAREKMGRGPHPILQVHGDLAASFDKYTTADSVTVGSNKAQAALMHYGGWAGRGNSVYVPDRPIIAIQPDEIQDMRDTIGDHLLQE
jgi:phage gpG-like protein